MIAAFDLNADKGLIVVRIVDDWGVVKRGERVDEGAREREDVGPRDHALLSRRSIAHGSSFEGSLHRACST
jgi:hypothetical protein